MSRLNKDNDSRDLQEQLEQMKRELESLKRVEEENKELRKQLQPVDNSDLLRVVEHVVSLQGPKRDFFLVDKKFRTLAIELFKLAPRKNKFRKHEIQQKKMELFNRFKELLIQDWERQTGERHTRWSVAGINVMGSHYSLLTDRDKILLVAKHPAELRVKGAPDMLAAEDGIYFRVKLALYAYDFPELMDQITSVDGGRVRVEVV